jgi:hypothetical protein
VGGLTVLWIAAAVGYVAVAALAIAMLRAAKRADEARDGVLAAVLDEALVAAPAWEDSTSAPAVHVLPEHGPLGGLAGDVRGALGVDRVAIVVSDPDAPGMGVVAACCGSPDLLGGRVPLVTVPATGALNVGGLPWHFARVPIRGASGVLGTVIVAGRRGGPFAARDLAFLERLARRAASRLDHGREARVPTAAA